MTQKDVNKKRVIPEEDKIHLNLLCLKLRLNQNTKQYLEHKYKDSVFTETEWKEKLKKDGLDF